MSRVADQPMRLRIMRSSMGRRQRCRGVCWRTDPSGGRGASAGRMAAARAGAVAPEGVGSRAGAESPEAEVWRPGVAQMPWWRTAGAGEKISWY
jgi:hypothetical protein